MNNAITFQDLGMFILFALAVAVGVFLIITLNNVNRLAKRINTIVEANEENISKTMAVLPDMANSVTGAAQSAKSSLDKAGSVIETLDGLSETASVISESTSSIVELIGTIGSVVKTIVGLFSREK